MYEMIVVGAGPAGISMVAEEQSPQAGSPQGAQDTDKRALVLFEEPAFSPQGFDHIVYALGGTTPTNFLKAAGIGFDGSAPVTKEGYETSPDYS